MNEQENSEEFFWKTYEKLPDNIKEALFSEENFNIVSEICEKNGVTDEETKSQLVKYIGKTLMGLLPIREFSIIIELELNLDTEKAKNISWDIDSKIFSHLRIALNKLYSPTPITETPSVETPTIETPVIAEKLELVDNTEKEQTERIELVDSIKKEPPEIELVDNKIEGQKEIKQKSKIPSEPVNPKDKYKEPLI
jgi:hypothetical protein